MGALIGVDFDFEATNFHLRWYLESAFPHWRRTHFPQLSDAQAAQWLSSLKDACSPPLTASRTLGALGSMVASRIAREFRFGGTSFVVSAEQTSGLRALEIGVRALQAGELDSVLVGAVDLCGDLRSVAAQADLGVLPAHGGGIPPGEGATAMVLKRLEDARADGHRIYAVVRGLGAAGGGGMDGQPPPAEVHSRSLSPADAFAAAFRIPNFLQNLLGEGVLSASFIPAYSRLRQAQGDAEARRLAGAVLGLLAIVVALVVALGVTFAPALVAVLRPASRAASGSSPSA